jgi:hypothetical protein
VTNWKSRQHLVLAALPLRRANLLVANARGNVFFLAVSRVKGSDQRFAPFHNAARGEL